VLWTALVWVGRGTSGELRIGCCGLHWSGSGEGQVESSGWGVVDCTGLGRDRDKWRAQDGVLWTALVWVGRGTSGELL
jgi:hypothetical protein